MNAFMNPKIIVTSPTDKRLVSHWRNDQCGSEQSAESPVLVVIGANATPEAVQRLKSRFDITE